MSALASLHIQSGDAEDDAVVFQQGPGCVSLRDTFRMIEGPLLRGFGLIATLAARAGYTLLSEEDCSCVFDTPDDSTILKITRRDLGYDAYARYVAQGPQNPHLPRIKTIVQLRNGVSLYELGRLEKITLTEDLRDFIMVIEKLSFADQGMLVRAKQFEQANPSFAAAFRAVRKAKPAEFFNDVLSTDNILADADGTLVINDPWWNISK